MAGELFSIPRVPSVSAGVVSASPYGIELPPGGRVAAFVRSTGPQSGDDRQIASFLVPTLAAGLQRCRAGQGDTVFILPGHSELGVGTTMLSGLVDGTKIIGVGQGSNMPVFRWTATTDNWALAANNCVFTGLRLRMEGANVTEGISITGADNLISNCDIEVGSGGANKVTTAINVKAGADRTNIVGNKMRGTTAGTSSDGILVSAAVDQVVIASNQIFAAFTTTNGGIRISGAATEIWVALNIIHNSTAGSTTTIAIADVASTGVLSDNYSTIENNGVASATGILFAGTATTKIKCHQNFTSDEPGKSGILSPVVVAT